MLLRPKSLEVQVFSTAGYWITRWVLTPSCTPAALSSEGEASFFDSLKAGRAKSPARPACQKSPRGIFLTASTAEHFDFIKMLLRSKSLDVQDFSAAGYWNARRVLTPSRTPAALSSAREATFFDSLSGAAPRLGRLRSVCQRSSQSLPCVRGGGKNSLIFAGGVV